MTRDSDIERVLDRFYAEGPTAMPDRLFLGVIDEIERVPQRRLAFAMTRFATMSSYFRLAAAAAVIAAVGLTAFAISRGPSVGTTPTPFASPSLAPSSAPSPGPSLTALSSALQYSWIGAPRTVPEINPPLTWSAMHLEKAWVMDFNGGGPSTILRSNVGFAGPATIQFRSLTVENGCQRGDIGNYAFTLSPTGTALSLTKIDDACAARAGAISGDWNRADCPSGGSSCLGDLDAGTHVSAEFNPFVPRTAWVANYGALSYTVPAGWANSEDCSGCFFLKPQGAPDNNPSIFLFDDVAAHSQAQPCSTVVEPGVGQSAAAIADWLTTLPGLVTTAPSPVTIGGLSGITLDLAVDPGWTGTCPYAYTKDLPLVSTFADADSTDPNAGFDWNIQGDGRTRVVLFDIGEGRVLLLDIEAQSKATFDASLPAMMRIVDSFEFHR